MNYSISNLLLEQNMVNDKNLKNLYKKENYEIFDFQFFRKFHIPSDTICFMKTRDCRY